MIGIGTANLSDQIIENSISGRLKAVLSIVDPNYPPPSSVDADRYVLQTLPGGVHPSWGTDVSKGDLVVNNSGYWKAYTPEVGTEVHVIDQDKTFVFSGGSWKISSVLTEYVFEQSVPSATWVIVHNLNRIAPSVNVKNSSGDFVEGGVK